MTPTITSPDWLADLVACSRSGLIWQDPPDARHRGRYIRWSKPQFAAGAVGFPDEAAGRRIAQILRRHPAQWAIICTAAGEMVEHLQRTVRQGRGGFRYAGQFETVLRTQHGQTVLFARYTAGRDAGVSGMGENTQR